MIILKYYVAIFFLRIKWALGITLAAAFAITMGGLLAFMPTASSDPGVTTERNNTTVTGLITSKSTSSLVGAVVLLDNRGIGGTSDVEVTWTAPFSDSQCRLVTIGGTESSTSTETDANGNEILGNDMVFMTVLGYRVAHNDVTGTQAILLIDNVVGDDDDDDGCSLGKDFITISTVGSTATG